MILTYSNHNMWRAVSIYSCLYIEQQADLTYSKSPSAYSEKKPLHMKYKSISDVLQYKSCLDVSRVDTNSGAVHCLNDLTARKLAYEVISDSNA